MELLHTLRFIINHPLNADQKLKSMGRFLKWQIGSRIVPGPTAVDFVNDSRLLVRPGMKGATGNIYTGLHEFEEMSFVLHALRKGDLFVDVGANVGSYTILAGKAVGAKCLSIEPIPTTFAHLMDNINLNGIYEDVSAFKIGLGRSSGELQFTSKYDTTNRVITGADEGVETTKVPVKRLDDIVVELEPFLIKIDVEGYETEVVAGADGVFSKSSLAAVIMELNGSGRHYGHDESELHKKMLGYGSEPFSYSPLDREIISPEGRNSESGNTIYVRDVEEVVKRIKSAPGFLINGKEV